MLAAKVVGSLQLEDYRNELQSLARDREWRVRYAALEALRQLPQGPLLLEDVIEHHEDKYARDMASRLLSMEVVHS
ncbi:HEAT repeat-containing protein [Salimicrobium flavidum]|uniref:HEAT repeat-containing protein n=2 Tax=Salimicrobium flavidum TaxID=570947 RepID=A0A1N7J970_9BACI|nr:HEAT repeat-containing protein [Salimicrobium flavidum]